MIAEPKSDYSMSLAEQLRLSNFVFEHTCEAIMITDKYNRIIAVNRTLERITGYSRDELVGQDPVIFSSGKHDAHFYRHMWKDLLEKGHWKGEVYNRRKNGDIFPEELSLNLVRDNQGETSHFVAIFRDISDRKAAEDKLTFYANNEPLTGLTNRRAFMENVEHHISIAKRHKAPFSLLFIDIDRFNEVNDLQGQEVGDQLLRLVAERINAHVRDEDVVCRYGGDEFTVLLVNTTIEQAGLVAEKILLQVQKPFEVRGLQIDTTCSIGIAQYPDSGLNATVLLRNASHAMLSVKSGGRNAFAFHNERMQARYLKKLDLRERLKQAIVDQAFEVYYQPIVTVPEQTISKFEALVRWPDGEGGFISPGAFIPVAEEFGLIHLIGNFVLLRACADLKSLHKQGFSQVSFSINRSISEFRFDVDEASIISQTIEASGLPYDAIVVEITESVAMSSNIHTALVLQQLRDNGVRIALDDFCTGYSSLSNLIEYKSDYLKIDKSFVDSILTDKDHQVLVSTLVDLATRLEMEVIAEGVENREQMALLQQFGCHYIQGFYYSPALPLAECEALLKGAGHNPLIQYPRGLETG